MLGPQHGLLDYQLTTGPSLSWTIRTILHHWPAKGVRSNPLNPPSYAPETVNYEVTSMFTWMELAPFYEQQRKYCQSTFLIRIIVFSKDLYTKGMLETWVTFYFNGLTKQLRYLRATRASLDRESCWVTTQNERQKSPRKECSIIKQRMGQTWQKPETALEKSLAPSLSLCRGSRVEGSMSRVEGTMSRVEGNNLFLFFLKNGKQMENKWRVDISIHISSTCWVGRRGEHVTW